MSRLAPGCLALTLAAFLLAPGPARGRQTEAALVQRLDSLMPLLEQARHDADSARRAYRAEMDAKHPTEAVDVGLVHVLVIPGQAETARDVVGAVWDRDFAPLVDRSPSLARYKIFFQWALNPTPYSDNSYRVRKVDVRRWRSRAYAEERVEDALSQFLRDDLAGTSLQDRWGLLGVAPPRDPQDLYRRVVVAPSVAVRGCMAGDLDACLVALGLVDDGYPIDDWYNAEERRLLVMRQATRFNRDAEQLQACFAGSNEACDVLIRSFSDFYPDTRWASPLGPDVHSSLLWYAVRQGGAGAWGRLLDHTDEGPLAALEAASRLDAHALAQGWRNWLLENRPPTRAGFGSLTLGTLFWLLLLVTLAARSTRWRLG